MPLTRLNLYREVDGTVPVIDWLRALPRKPRDKCRLALARLRDQGHGLRRPEVDLLRDGIYELRVGLRGVNYRLLYFFHGNVAAVVSHGLVKERVVPPREIDAAVARRAAFLADPSAHTYYDGSYAYLREPQEDGDD